MLPLSANTTFTRTTSFSEQVHGEAFISRMLFADDQVTIDETVPNYGDTRMGDPVIKKVCTRSKTIIDSDLTFPYQITFEISVPIAIDGDCTEAAIAQSVVCENSLM